MKKVVILQHRLLHYRTGLFERLRERCLLDDISVELVHGYATRRESSKKDEGVIEWARPVQNRCIEIGERDIIWQPYPASVSGADLVVIMQESRILSNYVHLARRFLLGKKVAYWGHGRNFQTRAPSGLRERWKSLLLTKVDWWFAYTEMTRDILVEAGFSSACITTLNNAIDTSAFKSDLNSVSDMDVNQVKEAMGIGSSDPVAVFCGSLYPDKRLELMVEAADYIRDRLPGFSLIVIGDGPSMQFVKAAQKERPWIHLLGVKKGREKAMYFKCASVMLNPGLVGLHIVDAFCAALVMVTTNNAKHSPEVAYLNHGQNGFSVEDSAAVYGQTVVDLFLDPDRLKVMRERALADSDVYSLENMVENFAKGIDLALRS
ncbi:MAG: glycosyltransferase family 4 protein [Proteobacteria bacterium]|nr:glycosyltransferase family 4 protein [Pseudomonadota bacterium]